MTLTYAVIVPGKPLEFRSTEWAEAEALVAGPFPGATVDLALFRNGITLLSLLTSDVSQSFPSLFPPHDGWVTRFVLALGGPMQRWAGTLVVHQANSFDGSSAPADLDEGRRAAIEGFYTAAVRLSGGDS